MNRCRVAAVILGALAAAAQAEMVAKYDRFTDRTELEAPANAAAWKEGRDGRLAIHAFTFFPGAKPTKSPLLVRIAFFTKSPDGWRYLKCHDVAAIVDGKPFPMGQSKHDGATASGSEVIESVSVDLPWARFATLANSSAAEFRVCSTELKASASLLSDWRALVAAGTPAK